MLNQRKNVASYLEWISDTSLTVMLLISSKLMEFESIGHLYSLTHLSVR